jgi:hypothetical protein
VISTPVGVDTLHRPGYCSDMTKTPFARTAAAQLAMIERQAKLVVAAHPTNRKAIETLAAAQAEIARRQA